MKIKIKHDRVKLTTSDTKLALLVLNELEKKGDKKEADEYEYKSETIGLIPDDVDDRGFSLEDVKKVQERGPRSLWTVAEDMEAVNLIYEPTEKAVRNKMLLKRHSKQAIRSRISKMRMQLREFKGDIDALTKALLQGRDLSVVDEREMTLRAERKPDEKKEQPKPKSVKGKPAKMVQNAWSEDELAILRNNTDLAPVKLMKLLPGRTKAAISFQKRYRAEKMGIKPKNNVTSWPAELKERVLELSAGGHTATAISKMSEFRGRTPSQINATIYRLKNKKK